tara:strand:- start:815 stop:1129 length:315 start_codon:yes stop_codon:yes gene_type:complete
LKKLKEILYKVAIEGISGSTEVAVTDISFDSRKVNKGTMYVAIKGTQHDGHQYIEQAVASGAQSVLCEILPQQRSAGVVYIQVEDSKEALGWVPQIILITLLEN